MKPSVKGIKRILKAFKYSFDGFVSTFKSEEAFRQDIVFFLLMLFLSFIFDVTILERVLMISSLWIVLMMELINTAIEAIVDRISEKHHPLSKKAKDIGSLLVLMSFVLVFFVWVSILCF